MDKEHTRYAAGMVVISRAENGYIVTLRLWDNEVTLVSETFDGVVGILRRVDWSGVPRGERLGKISQGEQAERSPRTRPIGVPEPSSPSPDESSGMAARAIRG